MKPATRIKRATAFIIGGSVKGVHIQLSISLTFEVLWGDAADFSKLRVGIA
jgi:hypothetical protein